MRERENEDDGIGGDKQERKKTFSFSMHEGRQKNRN